MKGTARKAAFATVAAVAASLLAANAWLLLQTYRRLVSVEVAVRQGSDQQGRLAGDLASQQRRGEQQSEELQAARDRVAALEAQLRNQTSSGANPDRNVPAPRVMATFLLEPGLSRGESVPTLAVQPDTEVRLRLDLTGMQQRSRYRALLEDSAGLQVWSDYVATRDGRSVPPSVSVNLPARLFTAQQYELSLWDPGASGQTGKLAGFHFIVAQR